MSPDKHFKGTPPKPQAPTGTQRKILPLVKANGFEFRILELQSTQKVDGKRGPAIQATWKVIAVHNTHVAAKNALAKHLRHGMCVARSLRSANAVRRLAASSALAAFGIL